MKRLPTTMEELQAMKGQSGGGEQDSTGPWRRPSFDESDSGTGMSRFGASEGYSGASPRGVNRV